MEPAPAETLHGQFKSFTAEDHALVRNLDLKNKEVAQMTGHKPKFIKKYRRALRTINMMSNSDSPVSSALNPSVTATSGPSKEELPVQLWSEDGRFSDKNGKRKHPERTDPSCDVSPVRDADEPTAKRIKRDTVDARNPTTHPTTGSLQMPEELPCPPTEPPNPLTAQFLSRLNTLGMAMIVPRMLHYKVLALFVGCFRVAPVILAEKLHYAVDALRKVHALDVPPLSFDDFNAVLALLDRATCVTVMHNAEPTLVSLNNENKSFQKLIIRHDTFLRDLVGTDACFLQELLWPADESDRMSVRPVLDLLTTKAKSSLERGPLCKIFH